MILCMVNVLHFIIFSFFVLQSSRVSTNSSRAMEKVPFSALLAAEETRRAHDTCVVSVARTHCRATDFKAKNDIGMRSNRISITVHELKRKENDKCVRTHLKMTSSPIPLRLIPIFVFLLPRMMTFQGRSCASLCDALRLSIEHLHIDVLASCNISSISSRVPFSVACSVRFPFFLF